MIWESERVTQGMVELVVGKIFKKIYTYTADIEGQVKTKGQPTAGSHIRVK